MFIKNKFMNKRKNTKKKENTHVRTHLHHHRVINSSTGADVEEDGLKLEMAMDIGIFVEFVDDEEDEETGMVTGVGSGK